MPSHTLIPRQQIKAKQKIKQKYECKTIHSKQLHNDSSSFQVLLSIDFFIDHALIVFTIQHVGG